MASWESGPLLFTRPDGRLELYFARYDSAPGSFATIYRSLCEVQRGE